MEISTNLINDDEFMSMAVMYSDIGNNFKNSINVNPQFANEIDIVYKRAFLNMGRAMLSMFNLKYLEMFEQLANHYKNDEELYSLSISLLHIFNEDFKLLNDNLEIKNEKDLDELRFIIEVSLITIQAVLDDMDVELAYEAVFQIQRQIKRHNLFKNSLIVKSAEFELNLFVDDNYIDSGNIIGFKLITD